MGNFDGREGHKIWWKYTVTIISVQFVVHFYSALPFHDMFQISMHLSQRPLTLTHRWISIYIVLMRYSWPLLLVYNRLDVNVNVSASNLHELVQFHLSVSLFLSFDLMCFIIEKLLLQI